MVKLTDFADICRLCLTKHEDHSVNLFSKQKIAETTEFGSEFCVAEMVESFCNIKIENGDGLPERICNDCWTIVSSMQKLQMVSLKSDQLLSNVFNSRSSAEKSDKILDLQIEFIDTQTYAEKKSLPKLRTRLKRKVSPSGTVLRENETNNKKRGNRKHNRKVFCEVCGKLVRSNSIEYHINAHKDIRPFKCEAEDCDKYFTSPAHAQQHFKRLHVYAVTRPFKCDICGKGFVQSSALISHKSYHFDPQIPCSICGKLYRNKRAVQKHLLVHSGERNYPCSECEKSFQTSFTLRIHMRTHTLEKPFSCTECTKTFAYKCLLKAHIQKYHSK